MYEIFPIIAALAMAIVVYNLVPSSLRIGTLVAGSLVLGVLASVLSGEVFVSWAYLAFDIIQVFVVASVAIALTTFGRYRSERSR